MVIYVLEELADQVYKKKDKVMANRLITQKSSDVSNLATVIGRFFLDP